VQITAEFTGLCRTICPHCDKGIAVRYRPETREFVHDIHKPNSFTHTLCLANGLRLKYQDRNGQP
jgi:hypothetical protein